MTLADTAALATDQEYLARLAACVTTEALGKPSDPFVDQLIRNGPQYGAVIFGPTVASAPGFGDAYATGGQEAVTDGMLLSAVQASWDRLSAVFVPTPPAVP
jgi:hypothetical protein